MDQGTTNEEIIWVVTSEPIVTRGGGLKQVQPLQVEVLADNINLFIGQISL